MIPIPGSSVFIRAAIIQKEKKLESRYSANPFPNRYAIPNE